MGAPPVRNETCYLRKKKFSPSGSAAISHPLRDRDELQGLRRAQAAKPEMRSQGPSLGLPSTHLYVELLDDFLGVVVFVDGGLQV